MTETAKNPNCLTNKFSKLVKSGLENNMSSMRKMKGEKSENMTLFSRDAQYLRGRK